MKLSKKFYFLESETKQASVHSASKSKVSELTLETSGTAWVYFGRGSCSAASYTHILLWAEQTSKLRAGLVLLLHLKVTKIPFTCQSDFKNKFKFTRLSVRITSFNSTWGQLKRFRRVSLMLITVIQFYFQVGSVHDLIDHTIQSFYRGYIHFNIFIMLLTFSKTKPNRARLSRLSLETFDMREVRNVFESDPVKSDRPPWKNLIMIGCHFSACCLSFCYSSCI